MSTNISKSTAAEGQWVGDESPAAPLPAAPAPTEQQDELPITRSTYGSLEACEVEQARRNAAATEQAGDVKLAPDAQQQHDKAMRGWMTKHGYGNSSPVFVMVDLQARIERKDAELRALAARPAPTLAINGDAIAKSKHILNLVDDYEQAPNADNRTKLRMALMAEFEAVGQAPDGRDAALEEAATLCDAQALEPECPERATYCADAIRALKGPAQ